MPWKAKDVVLTMLPATPASTKCRAATRQVSKVACRCTSISSRNSAELIVRIEEPGGSAMPATLTTPSSREYDASAASTSRSATPGSAGDPATPTASSSVATAETSSASRPLTTTETPSAISSSATARPIPRVEPVTTTALPASPGRVTGGSAAPGGQPTAGRLGGDLRGLGLRPDPPPLRDLGTRRVGRGAGRGPPLRLPPGGGVLVEQLCDRVLDPRRELP